MDKTLVVGLAPPSVATSPPPIRRVAVIGSGVAGLSVAHALTHASSPLPLELSIFEAKATLDVKAGAGVQLNGGLSALYRMNPSLGKAVQAAGVTLAGIHARAAPISNDNHPSREPSSDATSWETLLQLNVPQIVRQNKAAAATLLRDNADNDELLWTCILRGTLQQVLRDTLPQPLRRKIACKKALINLTPSPDNGILCHFADGSTAGPFDLVVGADGVNSACKQFVTSGKIEADVNRRRQAFYAGMRIRYAVVEKPVPKATETTPPQYILEQFLDSGAYGLIGSYGAGAKQKPVQCGVSVTLDPGYLGPFRKPQQAQSTKEADENVDWAPTEVADKSMTQIPLPVVSVMEAADRSIELGVYYHNPFSPWSRSMSDKRDSMVVLCGDAAHAFPPFLGQGANQAIQDAYCLAQKVTQYNEAVVRGGNVDEETPSLAKLLKEYENTRWPGTFSILWKSLFLGYLETGGPDGFYATFRNIFFKITGFLGIARKVLLDSAVPKL